MQSLSGRSLRPSIFVLAALLAAAFAYFSWPAAPTNANGEIECVPGTYSADGYEPCTDADPGYYVPGFGAMQQTECPAGSYASFSASASCTEASPGSYVPNPGTSDQIECDPGTYTDYSGASACDNAAPGFHVPFSGESGQTECDPGYYTDYSGAVSCTPAEPGNYVSGYGESGQTECGPGTYSDSPGATECTYAAPGYYVPGNGYDEQLPCDAGYYTDSPAATICIPASLGYYVPGTHESSQTECGPGYFSDNPGATECTPASPGYYVPDSAADSATECDPGTYADSYASVECTPAAAGKYVGTSAATQPDDCLPGTYSDSAGATECDDADPGYFVSNPGSASQTLCEPRTFSDSAAALECTLAPIGSYVDSSGATAATPCPLGQTTATTGSISAADCFSIVLKPLWTLFAKINNSNTLQPGAPDYTPGTWARSYVTVYIKCTPVDSAIDIDRADHSVRFKDGVHAYSTRASDECVDDDGDAADAITNYGLIMVDTVAPICRLATSTLRVNRGTTASVTFDLEISDATSGVTSIAAFYTGIGGAVVNSASGANGETFNVTMPNSTAARVIATWTIEDNAGNVSVCGGTIRAK